MSDTMQSADLAEQAVRRYLEFLADPSSAIDSVRVAELETALASTHDVIAKLKLHGELDRARQGDVAELRSAFARHARAWAQRNDVSVEAFRMLGVSDIALAESGFDLGRANAGRNNAGRAKSAPVARAARAPRSGNVSANTIRDAILGRTGTFTLALVMAEAGGSPGTIRKVIDELETEGRVRNEGADPHHSGRGRSPHLFRVL